MFLVLQYFIFLPLLEQEITSTQATTIISIEEVYIPTVEPTLEYSSSNFSDDENITISTNAFEGLSENISLVEGSGEEDEITLIHDDYYYDYNANYSYESKKLI